ncbi:sugar-binding transcriptional regulator [Ornithinicoccus hortensis]|uniref:Transcriptional regulator n=1 Tax=Ornithinicoccus hortensis TaxID=82346 RepID=A0A542YMS9_9MICO|nr:sugar-binding domain-containing protein [Ornithinicoccus hortensis]TQL49274.1 transcriptional regulator [Ornithinicoccus hortensis]
MDASQGPAELVLMAAVARHHYLDGRSKVQIADDLGLSRFKVARLLDAARECGLVRIEIGQVDGMDLDLSARLQQAFGLTHCAVHAARGRMGEDSRAALGRTAARLLTEILRPSDVLGLPWSRSVLAMTEHLTELSPVRVVQLTGAMEVAGVDASAVDIVRRVAQVAGGDSSIFHAPFALDDVQSASAIRRQASVRDGLAAIDAVTHAAVGVGAWADGLSSIYAVATPEERLAAAREGVIGEVSGVLFDASGTPVVNSLSDRLITLSAQQLVRIPDVVAIAVGRDKVDAVRAALHGHLVNGLVTDDALATALLTT